MPVQIQKLTPIQMPHVEIEELKEGRKRFTKEEWMDVMMRSIGMEPDKLTEREKWLLMLRMIPLVENMQMSSTFLHHSLRKKLKKYNEYKAKNASQK